jgi:predicted transcriptional regulator
VAQRIDWKRVATATLHPMQVTILEAAASRERLSPVQLESTNASVSHVAYHFKYLYRVGLLESAGTAPRRGATEHFYRLARNARH